MTPIIEAIRSTALKIGMELQPAKCGYLYISDSVGMEADIAINGMHLPQISMDRGFDVLGIPEGNPAAVERLTQIQYEDILAFADKACNKDVVFAQDALLLLQHCVLTKATHMLRYDAIPQHLLRQLDDQLRAKVIDRFGLDDDSDPRWIHLPLRFGGLSLFSLAEP